MHVQSDGGEVEDAEHAGVDELIGDLLRGVGGDGDDSDFDLALVDELGEVGHGADLMACDFLADDFGVGVEDCDDVEAFAGESAIGHDGFADVSCADDGRVPALVGAEDFSQLFHELGYAVADAGVAELAEVSEVFADLCIGEAECGCELFGADGLLLTLGQVLEFSEVETEAFDCWPWDFRA